MFQATNENLLNFLKEQGKEAVFQNETNQIFYLFKAEGQEFALFFRIYEGEEMLQLITFFPVQVKKERFNAMARMLHTLNRDVDLPGFCMDERLGAIFHRIMIPLFYDKKIDKTALLSYIEAAEKLAGHFFSIIHGTAESSKSFEEILKTLDYNSLK